MHLYNEILSFIMSYGYLAIFVGAILEGEAIILISGFLIHQGLLAFPLVFVVGFLGAIIGDGSWFLLGKYKGTSLISRWKWLQEKSHKPIKFLTQKPATVSFWVRFMYGLRHVIPFSLGMSGYKSRLFFFWNTLGAIMWLVFFISSGFVFGNILETFVGHLKRYQMVVVIIVIIIIFIFNVIARSFKKSIVDAVEGGK